MAAAVPTVFHPAHPFRIGCLNEVPVMTLDHMNETAKHIVDTLSVGTLVATLLDHLPDVTALAVFVWTCLRIWESILAIRAKRKETSR